MRPRTFSRKRAENHRSSPAGRKPLLRAAASLAFVLLVASLSPVTASAEFGFLTKWGSTCFIGWAGPDSCDGQFRAASDMAVNRSGSVYVADSGNSRIQKFDSNGNFITKWGSLGRGDGQFDLPFGVAVDPSGNVYVVEAANRRIQKFDSNGNFITKWGTLGAGDGQFNWPRDVAVDSSNNVYVADGFNHRIQKFDSNGNFITKWGTEGTGVGQFNWPYGVTVDPSGNVYVADVFNHRIQKFDSSGGFLGMWGTEGSGDGQFAFSYSGDLSTDQSGNIYVADARNNRIQKFSSNGTFLAKWGSYGLGDGQFRDLSAVGVDPSSGDVYAADAVDDHIQKFGDIVVELPPPPPPSPPSPQSSTSPQLPPKPLSSDAYESACNFKITSPNIKTGKKKPVTEIATKKSKSSSSYIKVPAKRARRLFTHGAKGYIKWGQVNGESVVCKKIRMTILQKRAKRYFIPGTKRQLPRNYLTAKAFRTKGIRFLKKKRIGKLRQKSRPSKKMTKVSFKDFNRRSKLGNNALNKLRKKGYRGTYVVIYSAQVDGVIVKKTITLKVKKN